jgi:hypothetical protein
MSLSSMVLSLAYSISYFFFSASEPARPGLLAKYFLSCFLFSNSNFEKESSLTSEEAEVRALTYWPGTSMFRTSIKYSEKVPTTTSS